MVRWVWAITLFLLSACAINDVPPTLSPALPAITSTVTRSEQLRLEGSCQEDPSLLESWLGGTLSARDNFMPILDTIVGQPPDNVRYELIRVSQMRDTLIALVAPDCTQQAHRLFVEALDVAEQSFQAYLNDPTRDIQGDLANIRSRMNTVIQIQEDLLINALAQP